MIDIKKSLARFKRLVDAGQNDPNFNSIFVKELFGMSKLAGAVEVRVEKIGEEWFIAIADADTVVAVFRCGEEPYGDIILD